MNDAVIIGNFRNDVEQTTGNLLETDKDFDLEVNQGKTKYIYISQNDNNDYNL